MNSIRGIFYAAVMKVFGILPINYKKIVFQCFDGKSFGDNPKAIFDELVRRNLDAEYIWILRNTNTQIDEAKCIGRFSLKSLYHLATARVWIDNSRKRDWVLKRKGQYYIQTWHGGLALKKIEKDAASSLPETYIHNAITDSKKIDILLSGSRWNTENYRESFWYSGPIFESGLPRSDAYFRDYAEERDRLYRLYNIDKDIRIALYAPTFRSDGRLDCYSIDYEELVQELADVWGGEWKVIVRLHPNIQSKVGSLKLPGSAIDGSNRLDISTQIISCDLLITDYSSCMFDAMNIGKRVLIYASDLEDYRKERELYFSFDELPFAFARDMAELIDNIRTFDYEKYQQDIREFSMKYRVFDDGHSSERVADLIEEMLDRNIVLDLGKYGEREKA